MYLEKCHLWNDCFIEWDFCSAQWFHSMAKYSIAHFQIWRYWWQRPQVISGWERERERESEIDRKRHRSRDTDRQTESKWKRKTQNYRDRERSKMRDREESAQRKKLIFQASEIVFVFSTIFIFTHST